MPPAETPTDRSSQGELWMLAVGLVGLATVTLIYPASSRMYASPWSVAYALTLAVPALALLRISALGSSWTLPSRWWTTASLALAAVVVVSAWFSPYQAIVLRWSAGYLSGIALFFWTAHWLQEAYVERNRLISQGFAFATLLFVLVSFGYWVATAVSLAGSPTFFTTLADVRNPSPLGHSNYTAGAIVIGLPWLVAAGWRARGPSRSGWIIAVGLALFVLFSSGSRGGLIGLGVLMVTGLINLRLPRRQWLVLGIAGIIAGGLLALSHPRIRSMIGPTDPTAAPNISTVQRTAMAHAGILMGSDRPLFGWGLHSTPLVYPRYRARLNGGAENVLQLHSAPLEIWAGLGTLGIITCVGLFGLVISAWRRHPTAAAALLSYTCFALTDYQLDLPWFWASIAVMGALLAPPGRTPVTWRRASRTTLIVLLVGLAGLITLIGKEDPTPRLNVAALTLAQDPAHADRAIALLEDSLALNPDQEIAHFNLGWLNLVSNPKVAEQHFRSALALVPDKGGAYFGFGLAHLNQGNNRVAAHGFALECLNDPAFIQSPWWRLAAMAQLQSETQQQFEALLDQTQDQLTPSTWAYAQITALRLLTPAIGRIPPGSERVFRRERTGYPVLMRNLDIPPPVDLFDARESQTPSLEVPVKGWLPSPLLLSLLDQTSHAVH